MPKLLLPHDVTAAERRDCVWASRFRRRSDEIDKGATITGTPAVNWGVTLNGTTDNIQYPTNYAMSLLTNISYHVEFWPAFAADDGAQHYIFDADSGTGTTRTMLQKLNTNNLTFYFGNGTVTLNLTYAQYSALWNVNGRNLITASGTSGALNVWFNGTAFTNATAWTPQILNRLTVGSSYAAGGRYSGRIVSLKFYNTLLTVNDHLRIWEGGGA